jgi:CxxC motif-containing protein (DUF1111 family)
VRAPSPAPLGAPSASASARVGRAARRRRRLLRGLGAIGLLAAVGCGGSDAGSLPSAAVLARQGGDTTVENTGRDAFAQPVPGLTDEQQSTFAIGNSFFNDNWVTAPASTEGRDGLGPIFNAQSCSSCHFKDGRGQPPSADDDPVRGLLVRLSVVGPDGTVSPSPALGDQLQDRAVHGVDPEGSIRIRIVERPVELADGTTVTLAEPRYDLIGPDGAPLPEDLLISPRVAPPVFGVGLLEAVPAAAIEAAADPDDRDRDGISGKANHVTDPATGREVLGRFGWKAAVPSVHAQNAGAFRGDIGITSSLEPDQPCTEAQSDCRSQPDGGDPEIGDRKLDQVTFYTRTLAVPARRDADRASTRHGQATFDRIGCESCHTAQLTTGPDDLPQLSHQTIRPYTDLLVHDLGRGLADDRPDGQATGREWRTPPRWGHGLVQTVNGHTRYLHDGRARNLLEAILWHGGEATAARERFAQLSADDRAEVLAFLESL